AYGEERTFTTSASVSLPTVTTSTVSNTTSSTATCGGNVTNDGNATVTARGVCWSTSHNPTVSNSHTTDGSGTGNYTSSMTGLSANTTYYVRAYATNSAGTAYGEERTFTTSANVSLPTVTTSTVSSITSSSATCGGNVTNSGNATVTARGVCWSTSHNPTVSDSHTTDGSGTGSFTSSITGLSQNTTYYVRAYAINSAGTAYGEERTFTTFNVFDQNGASNAVFTVASGRTVKFSRGNLQYQASTNTWRFAEHQYDCIGADNQNISSTYNGWIDLFGWGTSGWNSGANAYQPWSTSTTYSDYYPGGSYLTNLTGSYANADWGVYNRISNGGNQAGIWRTLTKDEWNYLLFTRNGSTVSGTGNARFAKATVGSVKGLIVFPDSFTLPTGITIFGINSAESGYSVNTYTTSEWSQLESNGALFLPAAGDRYGSSVYGVGTYGRYRSSSYSSGSHAWYVYFGGGSVRVDYYDRSFGQSVRLVRDTTSANVSLPTVTTSTVSSITSSSATCGGNVTNDGNATVTARGVCWSISHNPTVSDSHTTDGSGTGSFTSSITGLSQNTTYYVRAYATNSAGTAYGEERTFTTSASVSLPTVTTSTVSSITSSSATCGGNVTNDGNATVTSRGVCWSTSHNPTVSDSHTTDGSGTGSFTSSITGLSQNTTYYVRAYATNSVGTAYGNEVSFTTLGGFDQNGASNAVFTVASGRTVKFSRGNLQYQASTGTWRFAEHQYDCIGVDNVNISSSYAGWIDLFGWGTSGWNSGANAYRPWSTSTNNSAYNPGGSYTNNLTGSYAKADWGVYNRISNGGNQAGIWRTLTYDEWNYLLFTRNGSTVSGTGNARFAKATVGSVTGLIVFPDSFTVPAGITMVGINSAGSEFYDNTYTTSEWSQLESNGALFLPAAGYRDGTGVSTGVSYVGTHGYYWSSSHYGEGIAWSVYFYSVNVGVGIGSRGHGFSVRLVKD
nr:hypothetical protein [Bacteroidales bacterium]